MKAAAFLMCALTLLVAVPAAGVDVQVYEDAIDLSRNTGHLGTVYSAAFSPDGKTLATDGIDDSIVLWDVDTGRVLRRIIRHARSITTLAYSPDGAQIASGYYGGAIHIWDVEAGALKTTIDEQTKAIRSLAFLPDSKTLLSAGNGVWHWDAETGELIKQIDEGFKTYTAMTLSSDGQIAAAAVDEYRSADNAVVLREVDTGALVKQFLHSRRVGSIRSLSFSPDGRTLAAGGSRGMMLWDVETGETIYALEDDADDVEYKAHFLPDGERLAVVAGATLWIYDLKTGERALIASRSTASPAEAVSPDGERAAFALAGGVVQIWNLNGGGMHSSFGGENTGAIYSAAFSRHSKTLAIGSADGAVRLWDVPTLRFQHKLWKAPYSYYRAESVDFSKDGKTVLGANHVDIALWDVETGKFKRALGDEINRLFRNLRPAVYSPNGETIASIRYEYRDNVVFPIIELRDAETGEATQQIAVGKGMPWLPFMEYSPDGRTIALIGSQFFNVETGRLRATVTHHSTPDCFAYSPDGGAFAVGHRDGTVTIWNALTYKRIKTIQAQPPTDRTLLYLRYVNAVAYSPDGRTLASGGVDGLVRLWRAETGELKAVLKGHTRWVNALAYSPDGRYLVSGSGDGSLLLWNARRGEQTPIQWADIRRPEEAAEGGSVPSAPALLPNYPNPFNPETWIPFDLAETSRVRISIYNEAGELARELNLGTLPPGAYRTRQKAAYWDGRNALGERAASGIYFARIQTESFTAQRRMLLFK